MRSATARFYDRAVGLRTSATAPTRPTSGLETHASADWFPAPGHLSVAESLLRPPDHPVFHPARSQLERRNWSASLVRGIREKYAPGLFLLAEIEEIMPNKQRLDQQHDGQTRRVLGDESEVAWRRSPRHFTDQPARPTYRLYTVRSRYSGGRHA